MEKLIEKLNNPFDGLSKEEFQDKCFEIAEDLFCNYCINCNKKEYYFVEIEFYYWEKGKWDEKWNRVTYPRDGYKAGALFFHLSGIDICFKSSYKEAKFGGILVRSVMNENNEIFSGPLNCKDIILNSCGEGNMPLLKNIEQERKWTPDVKPTNRLLGKEAMNNNIDGGLNLCFYDSKSFDNWNQHKKSFDKNKGCEIERKGTYNIERFSR
jgi:hypothetical protein